MIDGRGWAAKRNRNRLLADYYPFLTFIAGIPAHGTSATNSRSSNKTGIQSDPHNAISRLASLVNSVATVVDASAPSGVSTAGRPDSPTSRTSGTSGSVASSGTS